MLVHVGPIDPQLNGIPAQGVIEEFKKAKEEVKQDPSCVPLWQMIMAKYDPTFINSCQQAIEWSETILEESLKNYVDTEYNEKDIDKIVTGLSSHKETKAHDRHLSPDRCKELGLNIIMMEDDDELQDLILSIHHCCMNIFLTSNTYKMFSNNLRRNLKFENTN